MLTGKYRMCFGFNLIFLRFYKKGPTGHRGCHWEKLMVFFNNRSGAKNGFSLVEVLVTLGIMSIAGMALMSLNVTAMKSNKSSKIRSDLGDVKRTITNLISCDQTLGSTRPTSCSGLVELKNKFGSPLTSGDKIGDWIIEAKCESIGSPATMGLSIYATQKTPSGSFVIDPIRNLPLDKSHPVSLLYNPSTRLCSEYFSATTTPACPNGINTINFQDQTYTCTPPETWPTGNYCIIQAENKGCPAGFTAVNPGSSISGAEGNLDGSFLMGRSNSSWTRVNVRGPRPGAGRNNNFSVRGWAFCCK